jgi:hypothetical protein
VGCRIKIGRELAKMPKARGTRGNGRPNLCGSKTAPAKKDYHATVAELGVSMRDKGQGLRSVPISHDHVGLPPDVPAVAPEALIPACVGYVFLEI